MFSRVLYKDGSYIPQARPMLWPVWHNISDTIFEEESDKLDCYNNDLDPEGVAEDCAKRYVGNHRDYQGVVRYMPPLARWLKIFQGPPGMQGAMGCAGMSGRDGKARGALDLQCPTCGKFMQDHPVQDLQIRLWGNAPDQFTIICNGCQHIAVWKIVNGLPIPCSKMPKD
jgi:hypothetical protein